MSKRLIRRPAGQSLSLYWKKRAFKRLGGYSCQCCDESRKEFLTIDHVDGGGHKHRKQFKSQSNFYKWIAKTDDLSTVKLRVLCMNCNWGTRYGKECPHTLDNALERRRESLDTLAEEIDDLTNERNRLKGDVERLRGLQYVPAQTLAPIPEGYMRVKLIDRLSLKDFAVEASGETSPEATGADVQH